MKRLPVFLAGIFLLAFPMMVQGQAIKLETAQRLQEIQKQVHNEGATYAVGYSPAMDKRLEELCTLREPPGWLDHVPKETASLELQALPNSWDWRAQNGTTPIKDQGGCGGCWAFGTVGPLESQIKLKCGLTVTLSEQYLISCNTDGWNCANGGWWAHDYHMSKSGQAGNGPGAVLTTSDPYSGTDSPCGGAYQHPYKISNWAYVAGQPTPTVQSIKQAIYNYGPLSAALHVGPKFQAYTGGIFNTNEVGDINHAIVLVGWVDDIGPDNGYWILRNSWGTAWGESGYMRIRYGINQVGYSANYIQFTCTTAPAAPATHKIFLQGPNGAAAIWGIDASGNMVTGVAFGPYGGWTPLSFHMKSDGSGRLCWASSSGMIAFWELNSSEDLVSVITYGPYQGWTPQKYQMNSDGSGEILWLSTGGMTGVWKMDTSNTPASYSSYGPAPGWTPMQYQ